MSRTGTLGPFTVPKNLLTALPTRLMSVTRFPRTPLLEGAFFWAVDIVFNPFENEFEMGSYFLTNSNPSLLERGVTYIKTQNQRAIPKQQLALRTARMSEQV